MKPNHYYIFWSVITIMTLGFIGTITHSNYKLAESQSEMATAIKEYVLVKPFPLLCRDAVY